MSNVELGSFGGAAQEAYDHKTMRIKHNPEMPEITYCHKCDGSTTLLRHAHDCPHATIEDLRWYLGQSRRREKWAADRALCWLNACRGMHGKLAMLKAELKKMRA